MSKVPGVIPSAAAGVPYHSTKRTRLEYRTVVKPVLIAPINAQKQPTSQEQLAENSNRLGELQKIVTEQKSDIKTLKKKLDSVLNLSLTKTG
ncbi:hypothetical protein BB561_003096 [Smittium simulii]|uniref:Uncharacterized protein n=1 Tax=Smittium simulii TaxID=133385 RepID=A0A2T9YMZ1_9FUNG|nr:hypothetical protein BB561_003096 [Smittium simulii]